MKIPKSKNLTPSPTPNPTLEQEPCNNRKHTAVQQFNYWTQIPKSKVSKIPKFQNFEIAKLQNSNHICIAPCCKNTMFAIDAGIFVSILIFTINAKLVNDHIQILLYNVPWIPHQLWPPTVRFVTIQCEGHNLGQLTQEKLLLCRGHVQNVLHCRPQLEHTEIFRQRVQPCLLRFKQSIDNSKLFCRVFYSLQQISSTGTRTSRLLPSTSMICQPPAVRPVQRVGSGGQRPPAKILKCIYYHYCYNNKSGFILPFLEHWHYHHYYNIFANQKII